LRWDMAKPGVPEHKVIITGTGRAGTTFLVHLLTELGQDTGITAKTWRKKFYPGCQAGLEHNLLDPETPYIVKNPALCETLPAALATGRFAIDHVYIPIRELDDAAASRLRHGGENGSVPGGLWGTADPARQRAVLAEHFHRLVHVLVLHEIPHTFLHFPRLVADPGYTFQRLAFVLPGVPRADFDAAFGRIADPSLVHTFAAGAATVPPERPAEPPPRRRGLAALLGARPWSRGPRHPQL
jgi:hypothetical protein